MAKREIETIAESVVRLAVPGMGPNKLMNAVRKEHPEASKKDVVRAAFFALIARADEDPDQARRLQSFALAGRASEDA